MTSSKDSSAKPAAPADPRGAGTGNNANWDKDEDEWRHPPVAPKDEGPLESLGRSVSETVTGPLEDKPAAPAKPKP